VKKHRGEANSTSASMKPTGRVYACSAVALLLHFYLTLTAKMEDSLAKLKHFSKLDFQSRREVINNGRPIPGLHI